MGKDSGMSAEERDAELRSREPDFAEEHESVRTEAPADGESESPDGLGGMDADPGTAV